MTNTIKSIYSKICFMLVLSTWLLLIGYQSVFMMIMIPISLLSIPYWASQLMIALLAGAMIVVLWRMYWKKLQYLDNEETINSNKVTIGLFLSTVALIAFPGVAAGPLIYASLSGNENMAVYAFYGMFGLPIFGILSLIGLALMHAGRPKLIQ